VKAKAPQEQTKATKGRKTSLEATKNAKGSIKDSKAMCRAGAKNRSKRNGEPRVKVRIRGISRPRLMAGSEGRKAKEVLMSLLINKKKISGGKDDCGEA